ncbi:MAG: hypothetical protein SGI89_14355 [bacterium]|nr:hypothetical protein [bacterium]
MKSKFEIFFDTDILIDPAKKKSTPPVNAVLEKCLMLFNTCFTSVINASEIFARCKNAAELEKAKNLLVNVAILGIPFRYSLRISEVNIAIKKKV